MNSKWLREPFFHFIMIGTLLFGLYEFSASESAAASNTVIKISSSDIDELRDQWLKQNGSEPDENTLAELVDTVIYQEVMLREAKRIGLDRNDTIIRRRLVQKMEFLSANLSKLQIPEEQVLAEYFEENRAQYRVEEKRSFTHIYFSRDKRGQNMLVDANTLLKELETENPLERVPGLGDNFILQYDYRQRSQRQVARVFGTEFSQSLFQLDGQGWQGPVLSEYGAHLVRIQNMSQAYVPTFADVRARVLDDFMQEQLSDLKDKTYSEIRERYQINIEKQATRSS